MRLPKDTHNYASHSHKVQPHKLQVVLAANEITSTIRLSTYKAT